MKKRRRHTFIYGNKTIVYQGWMYPEQKNDTYFDERTKIYLQSVKREIGLKRIFYQWLQPLTAVDRHFPLFWNPFNEGTVSIGKKGKYWLAQISVKTLEKEFVVVQYLFTECPNAEEVLTAIFVHQIQLYFQEHSASFTCACQSCGTDFHWTETKGTVQDKWISFQEQYCGCK